MYDVNKIPVSSDHAYNLVYNQFANYLYNIALPENPMEDCSDKNTLSRAEDSKIRGLIDKDTQVESIIENVYIKAASKLYTTKGAFLRSLRVSQLLCGKAVNKLSMPRIFGDIWKAYPQDWLSLTEGDSDKEGLNLKDALKRFTDQDAWLYYEKRSHGKEKTKYINLFRNQFLKHLIEGRLYIKAFEEPVKPHSLAIIIPSDKIHLMMFDYEKSTATIGQTKLKLSGIRVFFNYTNNTNTDNNFKKQKGRRTDKKLINEEYTKRLEMGISSDNLSEESREIISICKNKYPDFKYQEKSVQNILSKIRSESKKTSLKN